MAHVCQTEAKAAQRILNLREPPFVFEDLHRAIEQIRKQEEEEELALLRATELQLQEQNIMQPKMKKGIVVAPFILT